MDLLSRPLELPCGAVLENRLAKGAMTEGLADPYDNATARHVELYRRWSEGGAGLLLTGNVMVDRRYLERPGNVVIDDNGGERALAAWAEAGTHAGNHLWMQISHPGRQCTRMSSRDSVSPSAVKLEGMMGARGTAARARGRRDPRHHSSVREGRAHGEGNRLHRRADSLGARLSLEPVSLAARKPEDGRVGRLA